MKRLARICLLAVAFAVVFVATAFFVTVYIEKIRRLRHLPPPGFPQKVSLAQKGSAHLPMEAPAPKAPPSESTVQTFTAAPSEVAQEKRPVAQDVSPIRVSFETPNLPRLNQPAEIVLKVASNPNVAFSSPEPLDRLELLLRLPPGIALASEGWQPVELPPEEKTDPSGPWSLFERSEPFSEILPPSGKDPVFLARVPVSLAVTEEGINWVITTRARVIQQGKLAGQAFGVLFATLQGKTAEFHTVPKTPAAITPTPAQGRDPWGTVPVRQDAEADRY